MSDVEIKQDKVEKLSKDNGVLPILTRYNQQFFLERLNHVLLQANHYNGTLPSAWEKIERDSRKEIGGEKAVAPAIGVESGGSMHQIQQLLQRIRNAGIMDVVLEAAHAYSYQSLEDDSFVRSMELQCLESTKLVALLGEQKVRVRRVLFVDNYNPNPSSGAREDNLDIDGYIALAKASGFPPDYLIWEADMAPIAKAMIDFMRRYQSLVVEKENGANDGAADSSVPEKQLLLAHRAIELLSVEKDKVSCSGLDAALSLIKYKNLGQGIINVLPRKQAGSDFSFRGQQKKVRQILMDHLGVRVMPFFNLFISGADAAFHSSGSHNAFRKEPRSI